MTNRDFVISYMHWNGENSKKLTTQQHDRLYLLADGFGDFRGSASDLFNLGYDWSHVRDSSVDAFNRMANKIREMEKYG